MPVKRAGVWSVSPTYSLRSGLPMIYAEQRRLQDFALFFTADASCSRAVHVFRAALNCGWIVLKSGPGVSSCLQLQLNQVMSDHRSSRYSRLLRKTSNQEGPRGLARSWTSTELRSRMVAEPRPAWTKFEPCSRAVPWSGSGSGNLLLSTAFWKCVASQ